LIRRVVFALLGILVGLPPTVTAAPDTAVVCPSVLRAALQPWLEYRAAQGHRLELIDSASSEQFLRERIGQLARGGQLRFVVLVGDDDPRSAADPEVRARCVPTHRVPARVVTRWGSEPEIASDSLYGDLDLDGLPDVSVGRISVRNAQQLAEVVRKIIRYEQNLNHDPWRREVHVVAGAGGFGPLLDGVLETATRRFLTEGIPAAYRTTMTYASWSSPYCPDPRRFRHAVLDRLNEGGLFWVYLGHGRPQSLDYVRLPQGELPIFEAGDESQLRCPQGGPIAVFLSCYVGAFDAAEDCLAERLVRSPGGPVAVVSGSRVTMPYAMAVLGGELLDQYFRARRPTLGELLLHAQRGLAAHQSPAPGRAWLDPLAGLLSPAPVDLAAERAEHVRLFNLLGDPLLRLRRPQAVHVGVAESVVAGATLEVSGTADVDGPCLVELVCRRDRFTFTPAPRRGLDVTPEGLARLDETYRRANDDRWTWLPAQLVDGRFVLELPVPPETRGPCHVRVYVQGRDDFALGSAEVYVRAAAATARAAGPPPSHSAE